MCGSFQFSKLFGPMNFQAIKPIKKDWRKIIFISSLICYHTEQTD